MKNRTHKLVAAAALAAGLTPGIASAVVIDTFSEGAQSLSISGGIALPASVNDVVTGLTPTETVGGSRDITLTLMESDFELTSSDIVNTGPGIMSYNNDSGNLSTLVVVWDADGAGLGGVDLTDGGDDIGFSLAFLDSDLGGLVNFMITDTGGAVSSLDMVAIEGPSSLFYTFSDFIGTADVTDADIIKMTIMPEKAGDYTIDLLETGNPLPEPVTAALGFMGLGALGATLRRRRNA